jgi:hypothetical protein
VNRAIDATAAEQRRIGGVHYGIGNERYDVGSNNAQAGGLTLSGWGIHY